MNKKKARQLFREACLNRDNHTCLVCGATDVALDVHHITGRKKIPHGGYVLSNGISLCETCHYKAEMVLESQYIVDSELFTPDALYRLIDSDFETAWEQSERLNIE